MLEERPVRARDHRHRPATSSRSGRAVKLRDVQGQRPSSGHDRRFARRTRREQARTSRRSARRSAAKARLRGITTPGGASRARSRKSAPPAALIREAERDLSRGEALCPPGRTSLSSERGSRAGYRRRALGGCPSGVSSSSRRSRRSRCTRPAATAVSYSWRLLPARLAQGAALHRRPASSEGVPRGEGDPVRRVRKADRGCGCERGAGARRAAAAR